MAKVARALLASGLLVFMFAGAVSANSLNPDHVGATDATFKSDCTDGTPDDGFTTWHFIHTGTGAGDLPSELTAEFDNAGVQKADGFVNGSSIVMYNITIPSGDTLLSASDDISNDGLLNLSHVCVGSPPPEIPEAPLALLLPTALLATIGGYFLIQRRRSSTVA
ncbi:MAG TPA: hypothetical protein VFV72_13880 [Candidatus Limnocylindrales bacterium]|nr:hypothetical protein [Candidatus Limnocylindrales bacterium]